MGGSPAGEAPLTRPVQGCSSPVVRFGEPHSNVSNNWEKNP